MRKKKQISNFLSDNPKIFKYKNSNDEIVKFDTEDGNSSELTLHLRSNKHQ